jgi:hypothetical protein
MGTPRLWATQACTAGDNGERGTGHSGSRARRSSKAPSRAKPQRPDDQREKTTDQSSRGPTTGTQAEPAENEKPRAKQRGRTAPPQAETVRVGQYTRPRHDRARTARKEEATAKARRKDMTDSKRKGREGTTPKEPHAERRSKETQGERNQNRVRPTPPRTLRTPDRVPLEDPAERYPSASPTIVELPPPFCGAGQLDRQGKSRSLLTTGSARSSR